MADKSAKGKTSDVVVKPCLSKISPFDESKHEIDRYFRRFERYATVLSWEKLSVVNSLECFIESVSFRCVCLYVCLKGK